MKKLNSLVVFIVFSSIWLNAFASEPQPAQGKNKKLVQRCIKRSIGIGILALPLWYCVRELSYDSRNLNYYFKYHTDRPRSEYFLSLGLHSIGCAGSLFGILILAKGIANDVNQWYKEKKDKEKS